MKTLLDGAKPFASAIALEQIISRNSMYFLRTFFFIGSLVSTFTSIALLFFIESTHLEPVAFGLTALFISLWVEQILLFSYHNSFFFRGLESVVGIDNKPTFGPTYDAAKIILRNEDDLTAAFVSSVFGAAILLRTGITPDRVHSFLQSARPQIEASTITLPENRVYTIIDLGTYLFSHDQSFSDFLSRQNVSFETFTGALRWVMSSYHQEKRRLRFWSKDNLSRTNGLGREWTYGTAFLLERFSKDIKTSAIFSTLTNNVPYAQEKVDEIEVALASGRSGNVLIIGEPGVGKIDLVIEVERRINNGTSLEAVKQKHITILDTTLLFATFGDKHSLETTLLSLLTEAHNAGNNIIVIENISAVIQEAESIGVSIPELMDVYLASTQLQIIATDTPSAFHTILEPRGGFVRRFTEILIETADNSATTRILEGVALTQERFCGVIFTYDGLVALTTSADRYIIEGFMPDKAIKLLSEVAAHAATTGDDLIDDDFVYTYISKKTGIPAGPITHEERDQLLNLEEKLHQHVIGQDQALDAIARTMRRARAGLQATDRPIGSFLFLGPTGVGKTETAKALANIFFGGEHKMQRFDMSEFSGGDALYRLLGDGSLSGLLSDTLREHPYCVLLLDEFEKADRSIHDLFLQILDEGMFTNGRGDKVNTRNTIIIATSNAGSDLIMRTVAQREALAHLSEDIIKNIIQTGLFRPELINRFDSTIIFEPLTVAEQNQVAEFMLRELHDRVAKQGYNLIVANDLLHTLVEKAYTPEFGARPMRRMLQDMIEEKVAQKIIAGFIQKGDTISLTKDDFAEAELAV